MTAPALQVSEERLLVAQDTYPVVPSWPRFENLRSLIGTIDNDSINQGEEILKASNIQGSCSLSARSLFLRLKQHP